MSTFDVTNLGAHTDYFLMIQGVPSMSVVVHMHDIHSDSIAWANDWTEIY